MANIGKSRGAVIVTRVSTGEQAEHGTSLASQLESCRQKALTLGLPIVGEYEDAGVSGALLLSRQGMQAALADIREGRADTLICANLSRYSRDVEHQQSIRKEVRIAGGRVVFCDMDFDETPEGDLAFSIMGGFAEYERKVIRARTMRGKRKRAEAGQQPQRSRPPYGYHIITHADITRGTYSADMLGRYVLRDDTAPIAKRIFESYAAGTHSFGLLCKELNREGIRPPGTGIAWHEPTIRVLLANPTYKGEPVSGRLKCMIDESRLTRRHRLTGDPIRTAEVRYTAPASEWIKLSAPALISPELWETVQSRIERMKEVHRGSSKQLRMLSGLTYCPYCGSRAKIRYQKADGVRYEYLRCSAFDNARSMTGERPCRGDVYRLQVVEEAVVKAVTSAIEHPEAIRAALTVYNNSKASSRADIRSELHGIDRALEELRQDEAAAIQAQIAGIRAGASPDAYAEVFADIAAHRKDMEDRRGAQVRVQRRSSQAEPPRKLSPAGKWQSALTDSVTVLTCESITGAEKRELIGTVIEKVICHKDGGDVYFLPGTFGETAFTETSRSTFQTTCMGIKTQK